ncbi:hypothetical protein ABZT43_48335 [Streptomyces sp. NPDC005349]
MTSSWPPQGEPPPRGLRPDAATADKALRAKAALFEELGLRVQLCGDVSL